MKNLTPHRNTYIPSVNRFAHKNIRNETCQSGWRAGEFAPSLLVSFLFKPSISADDKINMRERERFYSMGCGGLQLQWYTKSYHFLLASTGPQGACKRYFRFAEVEYGDAYVLAPVEVKR